MDFEQLKRELNPSNDPDLVIERGSHGGDSYEMSHPSFATIQVCQTSGERQLFQSSVESPTAMRLTICAASVQRDLSHDWVHSRTNLIEVVMTPAQWAELLSSTNRGSGVPCTLARTWKEGKYVTVPRPPSLENATDKVCRDFAEKIRKLELANPLETPEVKDALAKLPAKHRVAVEQAFNRTMCEIRSNLPFVMESFQEAADATVHQAKVELSAYTKNYLERLGVQALAQLVEGNQESLPTLEDNDGTC